MLEEKIEYQYFVSKNGVVREEEITEIWKDGNFLSVSYTDSQLVAPGQGTDGRQETTKKIAEIVHTKECIDNYNAVITENESRIN